MQQIRNFNLSFQLLRKWTKTNACLFAQRNFRSVKWVALDKQRNEFVKHTQTLLPLSYEQGIKIFDEVPELRSEIQMVLMKPAVDLLMSKGIKVEAIIEYPFSLIMKHEITEHKFIILEQMRPKDVNDFLPLLKLNLVALKKFANCAVAERDVVPEGNRIYYFSKKLEIDAHIVAKYFVKNVNIFTTVFAGLQKKMRILLDYNVAPIDILQSLYVFMHSDQLLIKRLERLHSKGIVDIRLWSMRCTEQHFAKSLSQSVKNSKQMLPETDLIAGAAATAAPTIFGEKSLVVAKIRDMLACDDEEAAPIYYNHLHFFDQLDSAKSNISFLFENQIDNQSILDNPFLLAMDVDEIKVRLDLIKGMQPKILADFLPLLRIETNKLKEIRDRWERETASIEHKHRIYYFSEKLQISPSIVAKSFANHDRFFFRVFNLLAPKLDILLEYKIPTIEIIGNMNVFSLSIDTLTDRLELLSSNKADKISLPLIYRSKHNFKQSVEKHIKKRKILDDCKNIDEYLVKRLQWSENQLMEFKILCPALFESSIHRISEHIDYLLNEAPYTVDDINGHSIYIFQRNLVEIKCRINELKSLGCTPKLSFLAYSRATYLKKVKALCRVAENGIAKLKLIETRVREQKSKGK